jgi:hypothetical protein
VKEKTGNTVETIGIGQQRERIDKWESMKLKSFCANKEMVTKLNRQLTE